MCRAYQMNEESTVIEHEIETVNSQAKQPMTEHAISDWPLVKLGMNSSPTPGK